jgi:hypothetical protein
MQPAVHDLAVLLPPGSADAEIGAVQAAVFRERGLASAQCLPPLVPLAFLPGEPPRGLLDSLNRAIPAGWRATVTGVRWVEGFLYLGVESGGAWEALRRRTLELCGAEGPRLFPAAEGFFMGCGDAPEAVRPLIRPAVPALAFTSCQAALMRVSSPYADGPWWRELSWEILEERPLRGRRGS